MARTKNLHPNIAAFLDIIAFAEGTTRFGNDDGYNVIVGGSIFNSYANHPRKLINLPKLGIKSTAAGRYQLLARYFDTYKRLLYLYDFSPESQDKIALQIIKEQRALGAVLEGDFVSAVKLCANIWASFPGAGYGQNEHKLEKLTQKFVEFGGMLK